MIDEDVELLAVDDPHGSRDGGGVAIDLTGRFGHFADIAQDGAA
ncbi:hypothetical protein [Mesorhizobium jarvisii]|nr:hypothetical protein [Mesorhizobium jarvisii]